VNLSKIGIQFGGGDANAAVDDIDDDISVAQIRGNGHFSAGGGVFEGITHQIVKGDGQLVRDQPRPREV